jgi:hypothetical protein
MLPFTAKSVRFLRLIRSLHINPSEYAFFLKKGGKTEKRKRERRKGEASDRKTRKSKRT